MTTASFTAAAAAAAATVAVLALSAPPAAAAPAAKKPTLTAPAAASAGATVRITAVGNNVYDHGIIVFGDGDFYQTGLHMFSCRPVSAPKCRTLTTSHVYSQPGTYTITLGNTTNQATLATRTITIR